MICNENHDEVGILIPLWRLRKRFPPALRFAESADFSEASDTCVRALKNASLTILRITGTSHLNWQL